MYFHLSPAQGELLPRNCTKQKNQIYFWLLDVLPTTSVSFPQLSSWPAFSLDILGWIFWDQFHSYHFHSTFLHLLKIKLPKMWNNFSEIPTASFFAALPASIFLNLSLKICT